jgi:hypothetical protein
MAFPPAFFVGANLPWIRYGGDFGASRWAPAGGVSQHREPERIASLFDTLRSHGVTTVRWFVLCDGRAGIRFANDGTPVGLDDAVYRDLDTALEWTERAGLGLLPVLLDFHWCLPRRFVNGVQLGGRRSVIANSTRRQQLIEGIFEPLFSRYAQDPRIHGWDLINEPEWVTLGLGTWDPRRSVSCAAMRALIRDAAAVAHRVAAQPVTVGSASTRWLRFVSGLGLDFYQPHWYDSFERRSPLSTPVSALGCDAPVVLGEFPTRGSARDPSVLIETARAAGYQGALFWSVLAEDSATDFARAREALTSFAGRTV